MRPKIMSRLKHSSLGRFWPSESGVAAIEFAFVAPMMIVILLGTLQVSVLYIAQSYLEALTEGAMRIVLINNAYSLTQAQFNSQICANITALFTCGSLIVDLEPITATTPAQVANSLPKFDANGNLINPAKFNVGNANDKMLLTVIYPWPVIGGPSWLGLTFADQNGGSTRRLVSTHVFYKEPCLSANSCSAGG